MKLKLKQLFQKITVEPCIFMFAISECLQYPAESYFFYKRTCADRFPDADQDLCNNLKNESFQTEENIVQANYARLQFHGGLCSNIPPLFLTFLYGIICDRYSRKLVMAIPIFGYMLQTTFYTIMALKPEMPIQFYMIGKAIVGLTGGWITFYMAALSYIAFVTDAKERTSRIAIANSSWAFAFVISYFLSGIILDKKGFIFTFVMIIVCYGVAILVIYFLKHEQTKLEQSAAEKTEKSEIKCPLKKNESESIINVEKRKFQMNILWIVKSLFRKRQKNGKVQLFLCLCMFFFMVLGHAPFYELTYVFTKKQPLSWSQSMFGYYKASHNAGCIMGMLVVLPLLKRFKVKDTYLLMASFLSYIAAYLITAWAKTSWIVFLGGMVAFFGDNAYVCCRAIVSYILEPDELGKTFAVIGMIQGVSGMVGNSAFNLIYAESLETLWAGFVFLLGAIILLIPLGITIYLHFNMTKMGIFEQHKAPQAINSTSNAEQDISDRDKNEDEVNISLMDGD